MINQTRKSIKDGFTLFGLQCDWYVGTAEGRKHLEFYFFIIFDAAIAGF